MRDILGYEGLYAITSCGKVWSYKQKKFLNPREKKNGYLEVGLYKNGVRKYCLVHRLVAEAYIPNPNNQPQVNHRDEHKTHNWLNNLEWCAAKYNCNYGTYKNNFSIPVYCIELNQMYDSATEAGKQIGRDGSNITRCCRGQQKTCGGFHWRYMEEEQ